MELHHIFMLKMDIKLMIYLNYKIFKYNFYDVQNYKKIHSINEYSDKIKVSESKIFA